MEYFGKYEVSEALSGKNAGYSVWGFGTKDGKDYFIKQFLSPKYPVADTHSSKDRLQRKIKQCTDFEKQKISVYRALNENSDGNDVRVCEFFRVGSKYYITMPKIHNLNYTIKDITEMEELEKLRLCALIAHSIDRLHIGRIVHADLKHDNVLYEKTKSGTVTPKVIDFDSSFLETEPPKQGELVGDAVYFSPEACAFMFGENVKLTCKMDIFALGVLFHQYLSGELPKFDDSLASCTGEAVVKGLKLELSNYLPDCARDIITRMLDSNPDARPEAIEIYQTLLPKPAKRAERVAPIVINPKKKEPNNKSASSVAFSNRFTKAGDL